MNFLFSLVTALCAVLLATGCAHTPVAEQSKKQEKSEPRLNIDAPELFGEHIPVVTEAELFRLSSEQIKDFEGYIKSPWRDEMPDTQKLFDYLEQATEQFSYRAKTTPATATLSSLEGNCMALAVLTTALARQAGVIVKYQLMDSSPVFYRENNVDVKGLHVRSKLYNRPDAQGSSIFLGSSLIVDYLPDSRSRFIGNISEAEFLALYYGNLATEFLAAQDLRSAYWHARKALEYSPLSGNSLNTLAVIFRHADEPARAEKIYQYALARADNKLTLLKNYRALLIAQDRDYEAAAVAKKMLEYEDPSPFAWLDAANHAYDQARFTEAEVYYRKAIDAAPYLDYGYFGLARIQFKRGRLKAARESLRLASKHSFREQDQSRYAAKLAAISSLITVEASSQQDIYGSAC